MADRNIIPLYIAESIDVLDALVRKDDVYKQLKKSRRFAHLASKMKAELFLCREDQERCYILAQRYVLLMDHLFEMSDDLIFSHALYLKDYKTVKELLHALRSDLNERYSALSKAPLNRPTINLKRPRPPSSDSTPSWTSSSSVVHESDYIKPTGEPDPFLNLEPALEEDHELEFREELNPLHVPLTGSEDIFITPSQFYGKIMRREYILAIDIRPSQEYQECKIKTERNDNMINIPPELIIPGLSANTLGDRLPPQTQTIWERRDSFDCIIILDYDTEKYNYPSSKLELLRCFIVDWDFNRRYKQLPSILDGGLKAFVELYPTAVENSKFLYAKTNSEIDELLDLDTVSYPESGTGVHKNLRVCSAYSVANLTGRIKRDFPDEEDSDDDSTKIRDIKSEGALPKDYYRIKHPGVYGPYASVSKDRLRDEYKEGSIYPGSSTDFIIQKDEEISMADTKVIRDLMAGDREEILLKARQLKPKDLDQCNEGDRSRSHKRRADDDEIAVMPDDNSTYLIKARPSFDRSFKPARVKKPDLEDKKHGFTGIRNYMNSCFMNCIFQCLKVVPIIKEIYVTTNKYIIHNTRIPSVFNIDMGQVFRKLWEGTEDKPKIYSPVMIRDKISRVNTMYVKGNHEDAFEFFVFFFDQLSQDCIIDMPRPAVMTESEKAWYSALQGRSSFLIDTFFYQLMNTKRCCRCNKRSSSFETEGTLNLSMRSPEPCKLEDLLADYMADYLVSDFSCQECKCTMTIINKRSIVVDPEVLVIALKRYVLTTEGTIKKHEGEVQFPDNGLRFGRSLYKLYAIAQHVGSISHGHYFATCLLDDVRDDWIEFNDEAMKRINIRPLKDAPEMRRNAVGFFYVRQETLEASIKYE